MLNDFFQTATQNFESVLTAGADHSASAALSAVAGPFNTVLIIYVIVTGILCTYGEMSGAVAIRRILRAGITSMLLTATYFNSYVRDLFLTTLPQWIAQTFSAGQANTVPQQCDLLRSAVDHIAAIIYQNASWQDLDIKLLTGICQALCTFFLGVLVMIYEIARAFTFMTVCAAPFVIGGYLFDATKPFVEGLIGKLVGLTLLQLLVAITAAIVVQADATMVRQLANNIGTGLPEQLEAIESAVVFFGLMTIVIISLPALAYSIGRGVAINTGSAAAAAFRAPRGAMRSLARAGR